MNTAARVVIVVLVVALGAAAMWWIKDSPALTEPPQGDRIEAAVEILVDDPVYVAGELEGWMTDEQLAAIAAPIGDGDLPIRVIVWERTGQGGYSSDAVAAGQIAERLDEDLMIIFAAPGRLEPEEVGLRTWRVSAPLAESPYYDEAVLTADEATGRVVTYLEQLDASNFQEYDRPTYDYWGGTGGIIGAVILFGLLGGGVLAGIVAIVWYQIRARRAA